jgi:DNA polymerase III epsilon subunit-like protein
MDNLLRFNGQQKYVVIDVESNGLNLIGSRPYQLSWVVADSRGVISRHDHILKWDGFVMSKEAQRVNRFNWDDYNERARDIGPIYEEFAKYLFDPQYLIVGQNLLGFDIYMIKVIQKALGLPVDFSYLRRLIDTKAIFVGNKKGVDFSVLDNSSDFLAAQFSSTSIIEKGLKSSQGFLLDEYEVPHDKARLHEALYDVEMLFELFKKMLWRIEIPDIAKFERV